MRKFQVAQIASAAANNHQCFPNFLGGMEVADVLPMHSTLQHRVEFNVTERRDFIPVVVPAYPSSRRGETSFPLARKLEKSGSVGLAPDAIAHPAVDAREQLRRAATLADQAGSSRRSESREEARTAWDDLLRGRWSMVDRFDSGGRRYLLARENPVEDWRASALQPREKQFASYSMLGRTNKFIAYELGISESSVSGCLKRACLKLGVASRLDLIGLSRAWSQPENGEQGPTCDELRVTGFQDGTRRFIAWSLVVNGDNAPAVLTPSEQFVFRAILAYHSNATIAGLRGRSERTIANQVAAIFQKLRVCSRAELVAKYA